MLLVPNGAPLAITLTDLLAESALMIVPEWTAGACAIGSIADRDALDDRFDPAIDRGALAADLLQVGVPERATRVIADALADREDVLDLGGRPEPWRPPTLFEHHALSDVLGDLASLLPPSRVRIDRAPLRSGLNHCELGADGIARVRLLSTNGTTLAGRAHALVHELGHALIAVQRFDGRSYRAPYGSHDYGALLDRWDRVCDEEAWVRALADAWLLRRHAVTWTRTWPGAIDDAGRALDGDELATWVRARLRQGLGLSFERVRVRR